MHIYENAKFLCQVWTQHIIINLKLILFYVTIPLLTNVIHFFNAESFRKVLAEETSNQLRVVVRKEKGREGCRLATAGTDWEPLTLRRT
jgi:hypothetical protein